MSSPPFAAAALLAAGLLFAAAPPGPSARPLAEANNRFGRDLYRQLRTAEGNLFFSPHSIASALTLTSAGAAGKTREQLTRALHTPETGAWQMAAALDREFTSRAGKGIVLTAVSRAWVQEGLAIRPAFRAALDAAGAGLREVDFKADPDLARRAVNGWTSKQTDRQIEELLPAGSVTPLSRLVLASAVYFKGGWAQPFKAERTREGTFAAPKGAVKVPMMSQAGTFLLGESASGQVLELPYAGEELSMVLAVPGDGRTLRDVEQDLIDGKLEAALKGGTRQRLEVALPRFRLAASLSLPGTLRALGIEDAFGPSADFSGIDGTTDLYLSGVFHKAALEVNEEGSTAAAATGAVISARGKPPAFRADRPFVFVIRDRASGAALFMGRVVDPR